ncbi:hypothetical protein POL68_18175 [Stigmatella sp. ncwal1]|uniref:Uncharacterized protein n=1 Tax=Stigmatella ashevillensis TaxID=2995309 RepID=A0ABT5D9R1_9BACT|nr:hypothetical protein [Stigmatella ashevillena]MDC0710410.1 hypothetical protein [Stigmatella ashevillena]
MNEAGERWRQWRQRSRQAAELRWRQLGHDPEPEGKPHGALEAPARQVRALDGRQWENELRKRLRELQDIEILQYGEQQRLKKVELRELSRPDQKRLEQAGKRKGLYAMALAKKTPQDDTPPPERFLKLTDGQLLRGGRLNLQVFIDDPNRHLVGMNIQLWGQQVRVDTKTGQMAEHGVYMRYDLDSVEMGEEKGPVTHFRAHWHLGADPETSEDSDPRMPSLVLDPVAVLDILIETFFPQGPDGLLPLVSPVPAPHS